MQTAPLVRYIIAKKLYMLLNKNSNKAGNKALYREEIIGCNIWGILYFHKKQLMSFQSLCSSGIVNKLPDRVLSRFFSRSVLYKRHQLTKM